MAAALGSLVKLVILFFVIFDPMVSFAVFSAATRGFDAKKRNRIATQALLVAALLSFSVLILGDNLLALFNTTLDEFRIAGGIIIGILGIKMALGHPLTNIGKLRSNSGIAIAAIIGTPLLTGPAAITAIIVTTHDYGMLMTGIAVGIVLGVTALILYLSKFIAKVFGTMTIQILSTILGLITISWGVRFIITGLRNIFFL